MLCQPGASGEDFFRGRYRKKTSEAGRAANFIITRQVRPRYPPYPFAPPPPPANTCSANRSTLSTVWFTVPPRSPSRAPVPGEAAAESVGKRQELTWRHGRGQGASDSLKPAWSCDAPSPATECLPVLPEPRNLTAVRAPQKCPPRRPPPRSPSWPRRQPP